ncbi:hypothetical protein [Veillonella parvula]|uniref:hypothetical protein n=1 Tax=Veillonella parvula TaxID=29466 RepID=UPI002420225A|nr:hypothetical protein [Veillonella parvula]MBS5152726.1 hypothetical protein [Veillonella parvula]
MRITLEQAATPPVNTVICLSGFHSLRDELRLMCYNHVLAWCDNRSCGGASFH